MAKKIVILGGGISGLSCAWHLAESGFEVEVLEAKDSVGGLAGTVREGDYYLDYGPHSFFSEDESVKKTVLDLFDPALEGTARNVKFYFKGKYLDYPLNAKGVLLQMGLKSCVLASLSFLKEKFKPKKKSATGEEQSVEDWAIESFGEYLYRSFFKPYTEQFWKMDCTELSANSIPSHTRTSFANTLRLFLRQKVTKDGSSLVEREMLPTYYPNTGYAEISEKFAAKLTAAGGSIQLGSRVKAVERLPQSSWKVCVERLEGERVIECDHIVSTLGLADFVGMLKPQVPREVLSSSQKLRYRPLVVLGMVTERQNILDCSYMYVMNKPYNRISEMNKFSPHTSPAGENIIAVEMTCQQESPVWSSSKEELFDICIGSLAEEGILQPGEVKKLILVKAAQAYPIYVKNYREHLKTVLNYIADQSGIDTLGRLGEFKYMDIDRCIRRGFNLASRLKEEQS